jgi:hypothetical protein
MHSLLPVTTFHVNERGLSCKIYEAYFLPIAMISGNRDQMYQPLSFIACRLNTAQHVSGILMPIIRSLSTAVAASGLP